MTAGRLEFAHMGVMCRAPRSLEEFYRKHFGFTRARVVGEGPDRVVFIRSGPLTLELFRAKEEPPAGPPGGAGPEYPGWRHLAFKVDDVDAKLAEMGGDARITLGPLDFGEVIPGWRTAWVADPEGNIVEISQGYVDQTDPPEDQ